MKKIYFLVITLFTLTVASAQVSMTTSGSYSQDFNTLITTGSATWTDNSTLANWYAQRSGTGSTIVAGNGNSTTGALYSFGTGTNADRALGSVGSGTSSNIAWGVLLRNTSAYTITNITVAFTGEQWRDGGNATPVAQTANFFYKTSSSAITLLEPGTSTTYTAVTALNFTSPVFTTTASALDGNAAANRTIITAVSIPSLSLAPNDYIMLKWDDINHSGNDHGLSIDDLTITWKVPIVSATNGNWSNTATWVGGVVPTSTDNVIISDGHTVTADVAVTRDAGTTLTVNSTSVLATNLTYTNNGTTTVNGSFQINQGGWATGNNFVYGASGSLVFNNTSGVYGVNNTDVFFPSANGPVNLSVLNGAGAGVNFNSITRTVPGTFTYAAPISNYCNLTFSGSKLMSYGAQLTCGTFTYSSCLNTLTYNSGANPHVRGNEWTNANTPGIVTVTNNSVISYPGYGNGTICGDLNIGSGSALYADYGGGSASLTVGGNLVLDGNLSLGGAFGGDLYVKGNWTKAVAATFTPNNRTVFFDGTTGDQTITGATTFDYVILDKAAGNLLLASPISLNQTLTLTNGKVVLGANDLSLLNAAPSSLSSGSATSYVVTDGAGALRRSIGTLYNGDYFFPVGNTSNRQLATVNFGSISANNTLAARFITGASGNAGLPLTEGENIARTASDGYWEINAASATGDTYTGTFVANGFTDITDFTKVHLLKRADAVSAWTLNGTHVTTTGSNALASLQRTGMSGFSQFAVGGESLISLPSVMLTFSGQKQGSVNKLNWTTVSEQNNRGFAVERSADGVNYAAIGFVNSLAVNGNSDASLTYSFTDANPTGSKQYYRLRQQDINGVSRLSNVIVIKGEKATALAIDGLYPNPVSSQLNVAVSSPVRGSVTLQVVDMTGRILSQQVKAIAEGSNTVSLNVDGLSNGSYILKVVNAETGAVSAKFSKQ